jgi:uncharacterized protein (DUF2164 family)
VPYKTFQQTEQTEIQAMKIELPKPIRDEAIVSIERYFERNHDERIGNIAAGALLNYFLEELAPLVYNQAVADAQEHLQSSILELDIELYAETFQYWQKAERKKGK